MNEIRLAVPSTRQAIPASGKPAINSLDGERQGSPTTSLLLSPRLDGSFYLHTEGKQTFTRIDTYNHHPMIVFWRVEEAESSNRQANHDKLRVCQPGRGGTSHRRGKVAVERNEVELVRASEWALFSLGPSTRIDVRSGCCTTVVGYYCETRSRRYQPLIKRRPYTRSLFHERTEIISVQAKPLGLLSSLSFIHTCRSTLALQ